MANNSLLGKLIFIYHIYQPDTKTGFIVKIRYVVIYKQLPRIYHWYIP